MSDSRPRSVADPLCLEEEAPMFLMTCHDSVMNTVVRGASSSCSVQLTWDHSLCGEHAPLIIYCLHICKGRKAQFGFSIRVEHQIGCFEQLGSAKCVDAASTRSKASSTTECCPRWNGKPSQRPDTGRAARYSQQTVSPSCHGVYSASQGERQSILYFVQVARTLGGSASVDRRTPYDMNMCCNK